MPYSELTERSLVFVWDDDSEQTFNEILELVNVRNKQLLARRASIITEIDRRRYAEEAKPWAA